MSDEQSPGDERAPDGLSADEVRAVRRLLDRQAVVECVLRYARGVDRGDDELLRSAYHEDAIENHVGRVVGGPGAGGRAAGLDDVVRFLAAAHRPFEGYQRYITNTSVEIDESGSGDEAHAESYYMCVLRPTGGGDRSGGDQPRELMVSGGRYVDRLERRDGAWAIVRRVVLLEWTGTLAGGAPPAGAGTAPRRDHDDISYARPLDIEGG